MTGAAPPEDAAAGAAPSEDAAAEDAAALTVAVAEDATTSTVAAIDAAPKVVAAATAATTTHRPIDAQVVVAAEDTVALAPDHGVKNTAPKKGIQSIFRVKNAQLVVAYLFSDRSWGFRLRSSRRSECWIMTATSTVSSKNLMTGVGMNIFGCLFLLRLVQLPIDTITVITCEERI
jgi:hypothetical protein